MNEAVYEQFEFKLKKYIYIYIRLFSKQIKLKSKFRLNY